MTDLRDNLANLLGWSVICRRHDDGQPSMWLNHNYYGEPGTGRTISTTHPVEYSFDYLLDIFPHDMYSWEKSETAYIARHEMRTVDTVVTGDDIFDFMRLIYWIYLYFPESVK